MTTKRVQLGDLVRCRLSGVEGIAIGRTTWLTGCDNIQIRPQGVDRDGQPCASFASDEPVVEVVEAQKVVIKTPETPKQKGGPAYGAAKMSR